MILVRWTDRFGTHAQEAQNWEGGLDTARALVTGYSGEAAHQAEVLEVQVTRRHTVKFERYTPKGGTVP